MLVAVFECFSLYLYVLFLLYRYETDGNVESSDEILSVLSMYAFILGYDINKI